MTTDKNGVRRFSLVRKESVEECWTDMVRKDNGEFVKHSDYQSLQAKNAELREALKEAKGQLEMGNKLYALSVITEALSISEGKE